MTRLKAVLTLSVLAIFIASCANYKQHKSSEVDESHQSVSPLEHQIFLVGDAGEETSIQKRNFKLLRKKVAESDVPVTVLFLGDNIYQFLFDSVIEHHIIFQDDKSVNALSFNIVRITHYCGFDDQRMEIERIFNFCGAHTMT